MQGGKKNEQSISAEKTFPGLRGRPREKGKKNPDGESEKKPAPEGRIEAQKSGENPVVGADEVPNFFQNKKGAMKVGVGDADLERGNDLGCKKAEQEHGNGENIGMMEFCNNGKSHEGQSVGVMVYWS